MDPNSKSDSKKSGKAPTREPGHCWIRWIALCLALCLTRPALGQEWAPPLALPPCVATATVARLEARCERAIDVWRYLYLDTDDRLAKEQRSRALAESQLQALQDAKAAEPFSVPVLWVVVIGSAAFLAGGMTAVLLTK